MSTYQTTGTHKERNTNYINHKYELVSRVAFLAGVSKRIFENEYEPLQPEIYEQLAKNEPAVIVRNLCIVRTAMEQHYKKIYNAFRLENKTLHTLDKHIPEDSLSAVLGIIHVQDKDTPEQIIIKINREIGNRINNCKALFPTWICWDYIKQLFIMPDGLKTDGIRKAAQEYYSNMQRYPYQVYLNWTYQEEGNIFYNDEKFAALLYEANGDYFTDWSKVSDVGDYARKDIHDFMTNSRKVCLLVDCENADPYKMCAVLRYMEDMGEGDKISKIILVDDPNTTRAWGFLDGYTAYTVEHHQGKRVLSDKSLVDIKLATKCCIEHLKNNVDSIILFSSDSDYWGMIDGLYQDLSRDEIRFLVMVEDTKFSDLFRHTLDEAGIIYCYMDDFCTDSSSEFQHGILMKEFKKALSEKLDINIITLFREICVETRVNMTTTDQMQFYEKFIKTMQVVINEEGSLQIA